MSIKIYFYTPILYDILGVGNPEISWCLALFLVVFVGLHLDLLPSVVMIIDDLDFPIFWTLNWMKCWCIWSDFTFWK